MWLIIAEPCVFILENFTTSFPYDNGTLDVIHNCSDPKLIHVTPLYQSNPANWSYCKDISKEVLSNCSVACIGSICSINTRCVNDIDPRCLIPKYSVMFIRIIYECVHHSCEYMICFLCFILFKPWFIFSNMYCFWFCCSL